MAWNFGSYLLFTLGLGPSLVCIRPRHLMMVRPGDRVATSSWPCPRAAGGPLKCAPPPFPTAPAWIPLVGREAVLDPSARGEGPQGCHTLARA